MNVTRKRDMRERNAQKKVNECTYQHQKMIVGVKNLWSNEDKRFLNLFLAGSHKKIVPFILWTSKENDVILQISEVTPFISKEKTTFYISISS